MVGSMQYRSLAYFEAERTSNFLVNRMAIMDRLLMIKFDCLGISTMYSVITWLSAHIAFNDPFQELDERQWYCTNTSHHDYLYVYAPVALRQGLPVYNCALVAPRRLSVNAIAGSWRLVLVQHCWRSQTRTGTHSRTHAWLREGEGPGELCNEHDYSIDLIVCCSDQSNSFKDYLHM